jgi:hypothetical protein
MAADENKLNKLHEKLTDLFLEMLEVEDEEMPIPSATLKTMTAFLKDNEITCQAERTNVGTLKDKLAQKKKSPLASVSPIDKRLEGIC